MAENPPPLMVVYVNSLNIFFCMKLLSYIVPHRTPYPSGASYFTSGFSGVRVTRSLVLCVCFVDRCLFFWLLCCLFFDIRILITPLVSSNSSYCWKMSFACQLSHWFSILLQLTGSFPCDDTRIRSWCF